MAEFLIKAIDATNPDKDKDIRGCYKRGDVVQVYPDGTCTEELSPYSKMFIVKVPGMSFKDAQKYIKSEIDEKGEMLRRREYGFDLTKVADIDTKLSAKITEISAVTNLTLKAKVEVVP